MKAKCFVHVCFCGATFWAFTAILPATQSFLRLYIQTGLQLRIKIQPSKRNLDRCLPLTFVQASCRLDINLNKGFHLGGRWVVWWSFDLGTGFHPFGSVLLVVNLSLSVVWFIRRLNKLVICTSAVLISEGAAFWGAMLICLCDRLCCALDSVSRIHSRYLMACWKFYCPATGTIILRCAFTGAEGIKYFYFPSVQCSRILWASSVAPKISAEFSLNQFHPLIQWK